MLARRTVAALVTVGALLLLASGPAAWATAQEDSAFVSAINGSRSGAGLPGYAARGDLHAIAQRHAERMAAADGSPFHNPSLAAEAGGGWRRLGENVGVGQDVAGLHRAFMASPAHRANIMSSGFSEVGIGTARSASGRLFVSQVFRLPAASSAAATPTTAPAPAPAAVVAPPTTAPPATVPPTTAPPPTAPPATVPPSTVPPTTVPVPAAGTGEHATGILAPLAAAPATPAVAVPDVPQPVSTAAQVAAGLLIVVVGLQAVAVRRQLAATA